MTEINERNLNQMIDPDTNNEEIMASSNIDLESVPDTIGSSEDEMVSDNRPDTRTSPSEEEIDASNISSTPGAPQEPVSDTDNIEDDSNTQEESNENISEYIENNNADTTESPWKSLHSFVSDNSDKIENAALANIDGFSRVPNEKYMLFCSDEEDDAELVLYKKPGTVWVDSNIEPESIKVQESGIVIKADNTRVYIGKNNVFQVQLDDNNHSVGVKTISRSKSSDSVKVNNVDIEQIDTNVDILKLHIKRISPRLYNKVKDLTGKEEIKNEIFDFMENIKDVNHLIKIEKDLLYARNL